MRDSGGDRQSLFAHRLRSYRADAAFGFWLLAFGFWLLAFGSWLLALGSWLSLWLLTSPPL
ncbi:hypothetical protein DVT68_10015 [Dyella solisilvae]|uniref:Uncharacterized protein n=1 Tax=Dyella solisilvae TaxID=1920168 RepID=A0A370K872_9GAMM|nr:hypothetical protein DVT68_10015 [Dyella solisilvae]